MAALCSSVRFGNLVGEPVVEDQLPAGWGCFSGSAQESDNLPERLAFSERWPSLGLRPPEKML
jgi:hypothetical protein